METIGPPFLPGRDHGRRFPLERYLPPSSAGIASSWLKAKIPPGEWVLDPFGASPQQALEIARSGYRLLVTVNNPIVAFMLETLAEAHPTEDFRSILAELASARKGEERLEKHIQSLYATDCPRCHNSIQAKAFIWSNPGELPESCLITCPNCGEEGERPVSPASLEHLRSFTATNLHHARALERVALPDEPTRANVELALTCFPARQLYALFTIINRVEGLPLSPNRRRLLTALILSACDEANTLWPYPAQRNRPRQLVVPPRFRENNLWMALEDAVDAWGGGGTEVPLVRWPSFPPPSGGICLFPGRLRELAPSLASIPVKAILTTLPRPNQAFWTLSALWSGWLWGREAVAPIKNVLTRQRYDWNWLASALEAAFNSLQPRLASTTPFLGLISESEPSFISAVLLAADTADFEVKGIALRSDENQAQVHLQPAAHTTVKATQESIDSLARSVITTTLAARGEPTPYQVLHTAALLALAQAHFLKSEEDQPIHTWLPRLSAHIQHVFTDHSWLNSFGSSPTNIEKNMWWLAQQKPESPSLTDQVEMEVVRFLQKQPGAHFNEIDEAICALLPGLMTPPQELIQACLDSYGEEYPTKSNCWQLRPSEMPPTRKTDLQSIQNLVARVGLRLSYRVESNNPVLWYDEQDNLVHAFFCTVSALISRFAYTSQYPPQQCLLVIPGSRANLVSYKLTRDPLLNQTVAKGWHIIKFRHLRNLADLAELNRQTWFEQLNSDPIDYKATQMEMF